MTTTPRHLPWLLSAAAVLTLAGLIGMALAPTLLTYQPLLLILLSPVDRHMVLAAAVTPLVPFLLVSAGRRTLTCALGYAFGRVYSDDGIAFVRERYPRTANVAAKLQRAVKRAPPVILLLAPWPIFCGAAAGAAGTPSWVFLLLAAAGQLIWARLTYRVSAALGAWIGPITAFLRDHVVSTTLVCVAAVAIYAWFKRRERRTAALAALAAHAARAAALAQPDGSGDA